MRNGTCAKMFCMELSNEFFKKPLFKEFFSLALLMALMNYIANRFDLYWRIDELDSLLHFIAGATFSLCTIWVYFFSGYFAPEKRGLLNYFLISLLGVVFVSISWEIFELITGTAVNSWQDYPFDTSLDFIMDFLGAVAACLYAYMREIPSTTSFIKVEPPDNLPV